MSKGINKWIGIGNLGADPETRYTQSGSAVTNIRIGCTERYKGKDGDMQERTEWVRICFFGKLAEIAGEYIRKGSQVFVSGSLRTRKYQDSAGQDKYVTEIIGNELVMLDSKGGAKPSSPPSKQAPQQGGEMDFNDTIPFAPKPFIEG